MESKIEGFAICVQKESNSGFKITGTKGIQIIKFGRIYVITSGVNIKSFWIAIRNEWLNEVGIIGRQFHNSNVCFPWNKFRQPGIKKLLKSGFPFQQSCRE